MLEHRVLFFLRENSCWFGGVDHLGLVHWCMEENIIDVIAEVFVVN